MGACDMKTRTAKAPIVANAHKQSPTLRMFGPAISRKENGASLASNSFSHPLQESGAQAARELQLGHGEDARR
jgi:hypothetical protein